MIPSVTFSICLIALIMLVWFNSDAFIEWSKLLGFKKWIKYDEYLDAKFDNFTITYPLFLKLKYNKFIFKLIGCRLCLNIWLSGLMALLFCCGFFSWIEWTAFLSIVSLFIYGHVSKLLNENK